jgi:hypothetical protein
VTVASIDPARAAGAHPMRGAVRRLQNLRQTSGALASRAGVKLRDRGLTRDRRGWTGNVRLLPAAGMALALCRHSVVA